MNSKSGIVLKAVWGIIFVLGLYIIIYGVINFAKVSNKLDFGSVGKDMADEGLSLAREVMLPVVSYCMDSEHDRDSLLEFSQMYGLLHPYSYTVQNGENTTEVLSDNIISTSNLQFENAKGIIASSLKNKFFMNDNENVSNDISNDVSNEHINQSVVENENSENVNIAATDFVANGIEYNKESLTYDFLLNHFYTVDSTTSITKEQLNAEKLLSLDMTLKNSADSPQILIYHTHSQEAFVDSKASDSSTTIVGVGEYLAKLLREKYGFNVMHDTTSYDVIDGKIDRNKAYSLASSKISKILKENPNIEVVIDLHRDGIEGEKLVTNVNGKPTAKIMFFNGLSYTNKNGSIGYLENPFIEENLSFSLKLQIEAAKYYPGLTRKIYLKGYRYNLHLKPKALLIEAGAQNNTVQEEMNSMEPLADILAKVLNGQ